VTRTEIQKIGAARLAEWLCLLVKDHATPVLLVGVGHDARVGATSVCVPEGFSDAEILGFLKGAVAKLEEGR
jgi:hypothetical protein